MSFWIMLIIALIGGIAGGVVNYYLPANSPETGKYLNSIRKCILLGIGATFLVPLFLEIAQSKLMDDIHFDWKWDSTIDTSANLSKDSAKGDTLVITNLFDTATKTIIKRDTLKSKKNTVLSNASQVKSPSTKNTGKTYLLWGAYIFIAGAAGFRFINMLINNVVKEDQLNKVKSEKEELEKGKEKRIKNSQMSQESEDQKIRKKFAKETLITLKDVKDLTQDMIEFPVLPTLPPIIHPEDPQKGRFGGKAESNERKLSAKVKESADPDIYYNVILTVESTNPANPLNTDVIFYVHDSFSPSVFTYKPNEFKDGKAVEDEIRSYGAFTVGVITDNGKTLLELDLSEDKNFPKKFRER